MGIGHVAVGLGLKSADRRLNVGFLIFAALFADFLLGWFTLAGWESYEVPPDYASKHYLLFTFPWSHGLLPDLGWAAGLALLTAILLRNLRAGAIVAVAVLSHYLLDAIVHVKGLPVGLGPRLARIRTWSLAEPARRLDSRSRDGGRRSGDLPCRGKKRIPSTAPGNRRLYLGLEHAPGGRPGDRDPGPGARDNDRKLDRRAAAFRRHRLLAGSKMTRQHRYELAVRWSGDTSSYTSYSRNHEVSGKGKPPIPASSDPAFRGDRARYNPEEMLVASLATCHMLWYLHR